MTALLYTSMLLCNGIVMGTGIDQDAAFECASDIDCQLNGACVRGSCACDKAWKGPSCGTLDLKTDYNIAYGYGLTPNTSSWGGGPPVYDSATQQYHLFVSEIAGNCGMSTWSRMSQAVHAVSQSLDGPYERVGLVAGTETHNTYYAYSAPDQMHLIYTIFSGDNPSSCNPYLNCTDGTTPGGQGLRPPADWPKASCPSERGPWIRYSRSFDGPWDTKTAIDLNYTGMPVRGNSNPAPYVFPNGTVLMFARSRDAIDGIVQSNVFLFRAPGWNATYQWVPGPGANGSAFVKNDPVPTEDPVLWHGRRGFHVIFHSHPDLTHGWSEDGLHWHWSPERLGSPKLVDQSSDNERPRVTLDANGDLDRLFLAHQAQPGDGARTMVFAANDRQMV